MKNEYRFEYFVRTTANKNRPRVACAVFINSELSAYVIKARNKFWLQKEIKGSKDGCIVASLLADNLDDSLEVLIKHYDQESAKQEVAKTPSISEMYTITSYEMVMLQFAGLPLPVGTIYSNKLFRKYYKVAVDKAEALIAQALHTNVNMGANIWRRKEIGARTVWIVVG